MRLTKHEVVRLISTLFAAAANWFLSSRALKEHAIITSGACLSYAVNSALELYEVEKRRARFRLSFGKTLGLSDRRIIVTFAPVIYAAINVFLLAVFLSTGNYEGNADPVETKTNTLHSTLSVMAILLPYLINTYITCKYPMRNIPDIDDFSDESVFDAIEQSDQLRMLDSAFKKLRKDIRDSDDINRFFERRHFSVFVSQPAENNIEKDEAHFTIRRRSERVLSHV